MQEYLPIQIIAEDEAQDDYPIFLVVTITDPLWLYDRDGAEFALYDITRSYAEELAHIQDVVYLIIASVEAMAASGRSLILNHIRGASLDNEVLSGFFCRQAVENDFIPDEIGPVISDVLNLELGPHCHLLEHCEHILVIKFIRSSSSN